MRARILRTTSFRLTALYTVVFGASVAVILGILYWATEGYTERQFDATLTTVATELTEDYPNDPPEEIASDIEQSRAQDPLGPGFYLFQDRDGRRLAGNLPAMAPAPGPVDLTLPGGGKDGGEVRLRGMGRVLVDGAFVLVAADRAPIDDLQELWLRGLGWGLLATAVLGVGGGLVVSAGVLRRVDAINRICLKIMEGDLSQRLPGRGTDDEFDRLTGVVNAMLDRIEALLEGLRQVSTDIAHDLRTPLGRLRQQLEGALLRSGTAAEYERSVERAMAEADRLLGIFNALLRIAQVEAGSRRRGFARVDLSALVGTCRRRLPGLGRGAGPGRPLPDRTRDGGDRRRGPAVPGGREPDRECLAPHPGRHRHRHRPVAPAGRACRAGGRRPGTGHSGGGARAGVSALLPVGAEPAHAGQRARPQPGRGNGAIASGRGLARRQPSRAAGHGAAAVARTQACSQLRPGRP